MRAVLILGFVLLGGQASATGVLLCNAATSDIRSFVEQRIDPIVALDEKTLSERWAIAFSADRETNEKKLQTYCKSRPQTSLWLAFSELFDTD